ncbi:hypothetical protein V7793_07255 [Streptomyces sp. KLMMK]|uniref:hypothetical protein n=1 Tax=Streptomyces sp. KLMMK TaxID=3109353 RepID=UPI0030000CB2
MGARARFSPPAVVGAGLSAAVDLSGAGAVDGGGLLDFADDPHQAQGVEQVTGEGCSERRGHPASDAAHDVRVTFCALVPVAGLLWQRL